MAPVSIRFSKKGTHISARGKDAQKLFDAITKDLKSMSPTSSAEQMSVDCGSCPNVSRGCLGKCMKSEVA